MIEELELTNFRSHRNTKLNFTEGNNILVGISGSGKSSVLDAICFALFGTISKIQKKKLKISELIMNKPTKEESSKIKLAFRVDNKLYEVVRKIYLNKSSEAELMENGRLIAVGSEQVNSAIERILKINYDLFSKVIYAEQNQIDYFLSLPPGNRMNNIDKLLKLEKFETIRAKVVTYINKFKNLETSKREIAANFNEKELIAKKENLEKEIKKYSEEIKILKEEVDKLNKNLVEKENKLNKLKEMKKKKEELETKLTKLLGIISIFEEELKKEGKYDFEELEHKFKKKKKELEDLEKINIEYEKRISEINLKIKELEKNLEEKKQAEDFLKNYDLKLIENLKKELEDIGRKVIESELKKQSKLESLKKLEVAKDKCPTCDAELPLYKKEQLIELRKKEISSLSEELAKLENNMKNLKLRVEKELENLEKAKFFEKRIKQLINVEDDLKKLKKELKEIKLKKPDLTQFRKEFEALKETYEKTKDLEEKKKKLKTYNQEKQNIKKELDKIDFDEALLEKIRENLEALKNKKTSFEKDLEFKLKMKEEKEKFLEQVVRDLDFLEKNKKEIEFLSHATEFLSKLSKALVEAQETLRQEFVKTLNEVMNEIWKDIYPYEDYIGIRFKIEDRDYLLQLCDLRNHWINVEGFSSGGERAIASLVMRFALSIILSPKLKILILDEPTHNLDTNTIEKLIEILRTRISDLIEQLFIVTHDDRLIQAGTGFVYEFVRESAKKEPTSFRKIDLL